MASGDIEKHLAQLRGKWDFRYPFKLNVYDYVNIFVANTHSHTWLLWFCGNCTFSGEIDVFGMELRFRTYWLWLEPFIFAMRTFPSLITRIKHNMNRGQHMLAYVWNNFHFGREFMIWIKFVYINLVCHISTCNFHQDSANAIHSVRMNKFHHDFINSFVFVYQKCWQCMHFVLLYTPLFLNEKLPSQCDEMRCDTIRWFLINNTHANSSQKNIQLSWLWELARTPHNLWLCNKSARNSLNSILLTQSKLKVQAGFGCCCCC